jgi:cyclic pyranopterin phosphate synthase
VTTLFQLSQIAAPSRPLFGGEKPLGAGRRPGSLPRALIDSHGRTIRDLRLSITDRCNFRCVYCMDPDVRFADPRSLMSVDEMVRVVRACMNLGVRHVRLTGGEPTVHPKLTRIIESIAALGVDDLSMTTNGSLCTPELLREWKQAGLRRLTFSLDAVTPEVFDAMTRDREKAGAQRVVQAIRDAIAEGLGPVKVNAVVMRGRNEQEVPKLAALARDMGGEGFEMRFIEYMPLDSGRHWDRNMLVPADEIVRLASQAAPLTPLARADPHSTSETYVFADDPTGPPNPARIGIIAPVTRPFCGQCSRLRITADAKIRPCLFSLHEFDLMAGLRGEYASDEAIENDLLAAVWSKQKGHGISSEDFVQPARPMSAIGG